MGDSPHSPRAWAAAPTNPAIFHPKVEATGWNDCFVAFGLLAMTLRFLVACCLLLVARHLLLRTVRLLSAITVTHLGLRLKLAARLRARLKVHS
jgi:hypothetical protein